MIFRVGGEDAVHLEPEMAPVFHVKDMINLGTQEFYIKMTIDGESYDPFSAETLKVLPAPHGSFREKIIARSREKYTISADAAKQLIQQEEATILRSAQEKSIITGGRSGGGSGPAATTGASSPGIDQTPEPLI
jgi:hypothetical protein